MGCVYINGTDEEYILDIEEDESEAFKWFSKAAKQGDSESQFHLALMYKRGEGVNQDIKKSL